MKKLLFVLLLSFVCSGIYAQVRSMAPGLTVYANGDSYGYYVDEIPEAVSYEWSVQGNTGAIVWSSDWVNAVDITHSYPGMCDVICTITLIDGSEVVYSLFLDVYEQE